jgi:adenylosuccinate synthase
MAKIYRDASGEYGATTWRPRDVGWFDCVETRRVLATNTVDVICITKADVLPSLQEVKFGINYTVPSTWAVYMNTFPTQEVKYSDLEVTWSRPYTPTEDIVWLQDADVLPSSYRGYFDDLLDVLDFQGRVLLGTGPQRDDVVFYK